MCGIVGYIGHKDTLPILVEGLRKLEYRGYDSAGVATVIQNNGSPPELNLVRAKGKLQNLENKLADDAPNHKVSCVGIGHTRWATHGKPEEYNAHPHLDTLGRLAVVQNGIIENYGELREELKALGHKFVSDTDTEVIPHLIAEYLPGHTLLEACQLAVKKLQGAFAVVVLSADFPDELIAIRQQAPLVLGIGKDENFCASDVPAIIQYTQRVLPLHSGELARLTPKGIQIFDFTGHKVRRTPQIVAWNPVMVEKQGFRHFMLKEIYEQPGVVRASCYLRPAQEFLERGGPNPYRGLWYELARRAGWKVALGRIDPHSDGSFLCFRISL
jgi:glutamine---fructose-6-phosphate transaminase (isomerizing)